MSKRLPRDQRRSALLSAARGVLAERGYGDLTMERVARAAGVSKALMYDHFAHRREIYFAVLAEERLTLIGRLAPAIAHGDSETRVRNGVRAYLELVDEYGDAYGAIFRDPGAHDPEIALELTRMRDAVADLIAAIIAGEIGDTAAAVELQAITMVGIMEAAAGWLISIPPAERPAIPRVAALLSRQIWEGLGGLAEARAAREGAAEAPVVSLEPRSRKR